MNPLLGKTFSLLILLCVGVCRADAAAPFVHTQPATLITSNSAVLNGMGVPHDLPGVAWFEWGATRDYGQQTPPTAIGAGGAVVRVTSAISGLLPRARYHFRLVVSNATHVVAGADQQFATGSKLTTWGVNEYGQAAVPGGLINVVGMGGGTDHSIALRTDGTVTVWGGGGYGETNPLTASLAGIASVASGNRHNFALREDGTLVAWGWNQYGQTNVPPDCTNVIAVAGGYGFSVALRGDGRVLAWGDDFAGQTNVPAGLSNVVAIAAGVGHAMALKADGTVAVWGNGSNGQTNIPSGATNVIAISAGGGQCMVLKPDGTMLGWPGVTPPAGLTNLVGIAAGATDHAVLRRDGTVVAWGYNYYPYYNQTNVPAGLTNAVMIAKGILHTFALANMPPTANSQTVSGPANHDLLVTLSGSDVNGETLAFRIVSLPANGSLFQFTTNGRGAPITSVGSWVTDPLGRIVFAPGTNQFGSSYSGFNFVANDGDVDSEPASVTISIAGKPFVATLPVQGVTRTNAMLHGMVTPNGFPTTAWFEWGTNSNYGQAFPAVSVGAGPGVSYLSAPVTNLNPGAIYHCRLVVSNVAGIVVGPDQPFVTGGRMTMWGASHFGQLAAPQGLTNVVAVSGGYAFTIALRANGTVAAWGASNTTNVPAGLSNVVAVSAGDSHGMALKADGTVVAWGDGTYGKTNVPSNLSNVVAIAAGPLSSQALRRDGVVVAWGQHDYVPINVPVLLSNVVGIAASGYGNAALRSDGSAALWPAAITGGLELLPGLDDGIAVAVGTGHRLALRRNGTIIGWGNNDYGKATSPAGLSNVVALACGAYHNLALKNDGTVTAWGEPYYHPAVVPTGLSNVVAVSGGGLHSIALGLNVAPQANPQTVSAAFNADTTITLSGSDINGDPLSCRVTSLPTAGALYQYSTNGRGAPLTIAGALVSDSLCRVIFVPVTNAFGLPYSGFSFTTHDGVATSAPAAVTIHVQGPTVVFTRAAEDLKANSAMLKGVGVAGVLPTSVWFEWGNGQTTSPQVFPAGTNLAWFSEALSGLVANSVYRYRTVASNAGGIAYGPERLFTTGRKPVAWGSSNDGVTQVPKGLTNTVAIAGISTHILALQNDGTVVAWGENDSQQCTVPPGLSNIVGIAAGYKFSLALKSDGTVSAWGDSTYAQTDVPAGLSNVMKIASGGGHSIALRSNGTVVAWGWNIYGQTNVPPGLSNVVAIAAGAYHTLALKSDGRVVVWGWGESWSGATNVPPGLSQVVAISCDYSSLAIKVDGSLGWTGGVAVPPDWTNIVDVSGVLALKAGGVVTSRPTGTFSGQDQIPSGLVSVAAIVAGTLSGANHSLAIGNLPPVALSQTVKTPANHPLRVQLAGTDAQEDPLTFRITSLPSQGTLHQYDGTGAGAQILLTNSPVTDAQGRVVFIPSPDEHGPAYASFNFVAHDGELFSTQALVKVAVIGVPYASSLPAARVSSTNAVLNAMVVPNGFVTRAWFEWGDQSGIGFSHATPPVEAGAGAQTLHVSAPVDGLASNAVFRCRLVASNAVGVIYGAEQWFTTGRRWTAWGNNSHGQTNVPTSLKSVTGLGADFATSYAIQAHGAATARGYHQTNGFPALTDVIAISRGVALKGDGTVAVWGDNSYGQTNVPPGLSNVVVIASGGYHRLALRADGTLVAWGNNDYGQTNVPQGLSNVVAISCGYWFSVALKADGSVVAWGINTFSETTVPSTLTNVVAITSDGSHSLALTDGGRVVVWGDSSNGPGPAAASNVVAVACGYGHDIALRTDGNIVMWGNVVGSLVQPTWLSNVVAIAANGAHALALRPDRGPTVSPTTNAGVANQDRIITLPGSDPDGDALKYRIKTLPVAGALYQNTNGSRGAAITATDTELTASSVIFAPDLNTYGSPYATFTFAASDGEMESAPAVATVSISGNVFAATLEAGSVSAAGATLNAMIQSDGLPTMAWFEWGTNSAYGQTTSPVAVNGVASVGHFTATLSGLTPGGQYHFRIVATNAAGVATGAGKRFKTGGRVSIWGQDIFGITNVPTGLTSLVAVGGGTTHNLVLRANGTVYAWGGGYAMGAGTEFLNTPFNLGSVTAIAVGDYHNAALRTNRTVAVWGGYSFQGGPTIETNVPPGLSNVVAIAAGGRHTLALRANGTVVAWGLNTFLQTNVPSSLSNVVALAGGGGHSLALKMDGTVVGWGNNSVGQRTIPAGLSNVVAIAAGLNHSVALRADGTVTNWGGIPGITGLSNIVQIACGENHSLALRDNGTVVAWGNNSLGQTNVPAGLSNIVAIAAGVNHSLALGGNLPPSVTNLTVAGYPNQDTVVYLTGRDPNGDPLGFRVASLPAKGSLFQYTSAGNQENHSVARGAPITSPNTLVTDAAARLIFAPLPNEAGTPYSSFTMRANDGDADSPLATVSLRLLIPPAPQLSAAKSGLVLLNAPTLNADGLGTNTNGGNGGFNLRFSGYTNLPYQVWASTNLIQWTPLGTASATSNGWLQFVDNDAPNWPQRFYRISQTSDRAFNLAFSGLAVATYRVWASTNLTDWEPLGTASVSSNGWFNFMDFDAAQFPRRFYKAGAP